MVSEIVGVSERWCLASGCANPHFLPAPGETGRSRQVYCELVILAMCHVTGLISHVTSCLQRHLFSSVVGGLVLATSIYAGSVYNDNFLPIPPGAIL